MRSDLTTGEADAWRAGVAAAAVELRAMAARMRRAVANDERHSCGALMESTVEVLTRAAALETAADALAEMEPPG